jgi:hypothetical protein
VVGTKRDTLFSHLLENSIFLLQGKAFVRKIYCMIIAAEGLTRVENIDKDFKKKSI